MNLAQRLSEAAVSDTKQVEVKGFGSVELMKLNAGHAVDLFGMKGAEMQLAVAALSLSENGKRHADVVGFPAALQHIKRLDMTTALEIGRLGIEFSKLTDSDTEESEKNLTSG